MKTSAFIQLALLIAFLVDVTLVFFGFSESRPSIFLLTLTYWNLALPERISLFSIIIFGLVYDLFQGTLFGVYAIAFLSITYIFQRFFYQFRTLSILQQCFLVFIISFFLKLYLGFDFEDVGEASSTLIDLDYIKLSALHSLSNALIWPFLFFCLRFYRRKWIGIRR